MQHKYPFVVLHIEIDGEHVDVNVHPTKMELRFNNQQEVYNAIYSAVDQGLHEKELIPHVEMPEPKTAVQSTPESKPVVRSTPESKPAVRSAPEPKTAVQSAPEHNLEYFMSKMKERVLAEHEEKKKKEEAVTKQPVNTIQTIAEEKHLTCRILPSDRKYQHRQLRQNHQNKWNFSKIICLPERPCRNIK